MRVEATISEPFLLSSYSTSLHLQKSGDGAKQYATLTNVFVTHEEASGSSDGYATVTAQADGVHVLDVSTLHPLISHTLGPSTTFSCPALTRSALQDSENICTTYAVIETSPELGAGENGRTIWMWRENLSGSLMDRTIQKKKSVVISHLICGLYPCEDLPSRLLALSPMGEVTVLDAELDVKSVWMPPREVRDTLQTFVYAQKSCSFVPSWVTPSRGAIVILLETTKDSTHVRTLCVDEEDKFVELGDSPLPHKRDQISSVSCSPTGYFSILKRDGSWHSFQLESLNGDSVKPSSATETFRLAGLSFISHSDNFNKDVSLLSLGSSHVLLSATTKSPAQDIVLLLWDLQYSVLLASFTLPVPSSISQSKATSIKLDLVAASSSQALLILSPLPSSSERKSKHTSSRSSVLVVPYTVPPRSTIANAIGRASAGEKWIDQGTTSTSPYSRQAHHDAAHSKVLAAMQSAMERNHPQAANLAFFEWEKREKAAEKHAGPDVTAPGQSETRADEHPALGYSFVTDVLNIVLQPSKPANTPYSSEILHYLLGRKAVSGNMVEGGLLAVLRSKNDWQSIQLAFDNVLDIWEAEIVECLRLVIAQQQHNNAASKDEMQVDFVLTDLPTLPTFLALCVSYPTTPATLRSALRHSIKDAEDITAILQVLYNWMDDWSKRDINFFPPKKMRKMKKKAMRKKHGVPILEAEEQNTTHELPPLDKILAFLQTLLDASFLTLLQYRPSHPILQDIASQIEPAIVSIEQMEQLRGPLESFAIAHAKAVREAGEDKRKKPVVDWKQKRRQAHEKAGMSIGLYQLEELVL